MMRRVRAHAQSLRACGKAVFFAGALQVFVQLAGCGPAAYAGEALAAPMEPRVAWSVVERMQSLHEAKVHELEARLRAAEARCVTRNTVAATPVPRTLQAVADDEYKPQRERAVPIGKLRPDDEDGVSSKKVVRSTTRSHTSYDRTDRSEAIASRSRPKKKRKHRRRRAPVQQVLYSTQQYAPQEHCWSLFSLHVCMPADEDD